MFRTFAQQINTRLNTLTEQELFVTLPGDDLWATYLAAFPEGTNLLYRERTEHDCSCCKNFIRQYGNVVAIDMNGTITSMWDVQDAPYPYDVVAKAMHEAVINHPITNLFRTKETKYGAEHNFEKLEDGGVKKWNHFWGEIKPKHYNTAPDQVRGEYRTRIQTLKRGLEELKPEALDTVLELIDAKALYRGEEHKRTVLEFKAAQRANTGELFLWANASSPAAHFRNSVIGTLIQDLSEGKDLEYAVKSFETKVAPANYKRPTALITQSMVDQAVKTMTELGLEPALSRRLARLTDVNINDVLWASNKAKSKMTGGVADMLASAVKTKAPSKATDVTIDAFLADVLPKTRDMAVFVKNKHRSNLMVLTAPVEPDAPRLFKWDNGFAWSYSGNVADSDLRQAVAGRGGRVDGVFRFSHMWNYGKRNASLMDLHVFMPGSTKGVEDGCNDNYGTGRRVGWNNRKDNISGGVQDVDYVKEAPVGYVPVENITFPELSKMPEGQYICKIHNWNLRAPTEGGFKAEIEFGGQVYEYEVDRPLKQKEWVTVAVVTLKNGVFSIEHKLPTSSARQEVWGIQTESFVDVNTIMLSPNHWGDNATGNKHYFFVLDGCHTDEDMRGIYNEFLRGDLDQHRRVFEVLGSKTKCAQDSDGMSGLGFSSTRSDEVVVRCDGRLFNVKF